MTLSLFDQFLSPQLMGVPLTTLALLFPTTLIFTPYTLPRSRIMALQVWAITSLTKHLLNPLAKPTHAWALPLTSAFFFLLLLNLLGLLPYTFTPTTQLSLNMGLALPLWFGMVLMGFRHQPTKALAHMLPPGTPGPLIPMLVLVETVSVLVRPIALTVRLTANLTAGHLLLTLISFTLLALLRLLPIFALTALLPLTLLSLLEIAMAMIQAYVFVLLLSLYLQENT